jgi:hypothetical protein
MHSDIPKVLKRNSCIYPLVEIPYYHRGWILTNRQDPAIKAFF